MKRNFKIALTFTMFFAALCAAMTSCNSSSSSTVKASDLYVTPTELRLTEGNSSTVKATVVPTTHSNPVTWKSSNESVAKVTDGLVVAVSAGKATVTATVDGLSATCDVTVISSSSEIKPEV